MRSVEQRTGIWRLSLEQIEATVADHLGRGRVPGNQSVPCFSRQISMYLANKVAGWSTTRIGRFYNGRHHTTVLHAIGKIERLRRTDESIDALIEVLTAVLSPTMEGRFSQRFEPGWSTALIEAVASKVLARIVDRLPQGDVINPQKTEEASSDSICVDIIDCPCHDGGGVIPAFDPATGALPPGDYRATLEEIGSRFGFTPRRRWLLKGLRAAVSAFWAAGVEDIFIDGSFCTEKPDPGDVDGYWVEPDDGVYDRIDPYWIDFEMILVPHVRKQKWRMWADHGVEFFIHPAMQARPELGFPDFFRQDREGVPRGVIQVVRSKSL